MAVHGRGVHFDACQADEGHDGQRPHHFGEGTAAFGPPFPKGKSMEIKTPLSLAPKGASVTELYPLFGGYCLEPRTIRLHRYGITIPGAAPLCFKGRNREEIAALALAMTGG